MADAPVYVQLERRDDGVAVIRLDNPKVNALKVELLAQLQAAAEELTANPPGAVVVRPPGDIGRPGPPVYPEQPIARPPGGATTLPAQTPGGATTLPARPSANNTGSRPSASTSSRSRMPASQPRVSSSSRGSLPRMSRGGGGRRR